MKGNKVYTQYTTSCIAIKTKQLSSNNKTMPIDDNQPRNTQLNEINDAINIDSDEDLSDFENFVNTENEVEIDQDRYSQYEPLNTEPYMEGNGHAHRQQYTHRAVVQWIESSQPLFTEQEYQSFERQREAQQEQIDQQEESDLQVDTIKKIMSNFVLPSENIPSWANLVPEEKWIPFLLDQRNQNKL